jgi:transposase InsO family protein
LRFFRGHGIKVYRGMTDNGTSLKSYRYRKVPRMLGIKPRRTRPYTPRTNGKAERFVQTALREWAKLTKGSSGRSLLAEQSLTKRLRRYGRRRTWLKAYHHSDERKQSLLPFLHHDNSHRPNMGIHGKPPISGRNVNNLLRHDS